MHIVATPNAPQARGPYAQGIVANGFLFAAGQVALHPATGELVQGGVDVQARRVLDNLKAVLEAAGTSLEHVVKATVYLTDMGQFEIVNQICAEHFGRHTPARSTIAVSGLPLTAAIEVDVVALLGNQA